MLNSTVLLFDASGRIRNKAAVPASYSGGVGFESGKTLSAIAEGAPEHYHNANPFNASGLLVIAVGAPTHYSQGGLPHTATGAVAVTVNGTVDHYNHGLPYAANGSLAFATAGT